MSDGIQLYPFSDGSIKPCEGWTAPRGNGLNEVLEKAFGGLAGEGFEYEKTDGTIKTVRLRDKNESFLVHYVARAVSGGGRSKDRPNELRIQTDPADANALAQINAEGGSAFLIGVYRNGDAEALVVWRPLGTTKAKGSISKQIACETVAKALTNGIAKETYPGGETTVFAIKPELFRGLISIMDESELPRGILKRNMEEDRQNEGQRNLIYFGAPGTGKSHNLNERAEKEFDEDKIRRVTFHPDYTYAQFVGSFKPYTDPEENGKVTYKYISGPFLETYLDAVTHPYGKYVLIVEELNRANPAAVFGDVFQLLDRNSHGESEYSVAVPKEMANRIQEYFDDLPQEEKDSLENYYDDLGCEGILEQSKAHLSIPSNMYLWATMNSADQGVYPMDTAFKRRWEFKYIGIDDEEGKVDGYIVPVGNTGRQIAWNELRKAINEKLIDVKVNEDKLLGPFFIAPSTLGEPEKFNDVFKSKVLLYLFEDAAKTKKSTFFTNAVSTYSDLCKLYDSEGPESVIDGIVVMDAQPAEEGSQGEEEADNLAGNE